MGKYLDIIRRFEQEQEREKSEICEKSPTATRIYTAGPNPPDNLIRLNRFFRTFSELERRCPDHVEVADWRQISPEAWRNWHRFGWVACPANKRHWCFDQACEIGPSCKAMRALGLAGDGSSLPRKLRPTCGAKNRRGEPCGVRVEPGKRRCRFHGELSTGPKTAKGKARIAEAQRRRWAAAIAECECC